MGKELQVFQNFSHEDQDASFIVRGLEGLGLAAMARDFPNSGLVNKTFAMTPAEYEDQNYKAIKTMLHFCCQKTGLRVPSDSTGMAMCFDNKMFETLFNSIITETLSGIMVKTQPSQILAMADITNVGVGDSKTFEIESKALPLMQRTSYNSNVTLLDTWTKQSITVVPKPWTAGVTMDYIRILANDFDMGKEIAKINMSMLVAQYRLIVGIIFDSTPINNTPFYQSTWSPGNYVKLAQYLQVFNGTPGVKAYGTLPAFNTLAMLATKGIGFATQDDVIREGYLGRIYGVDSVMIEQATSYSKPLTTANVDSQLIVPDDKIVLLSDVGDKPVKLVRENYVRVIQDDQLSTSQTRLQYSFFNSFDAALATQANYAIQGVQNS